MTNKTPFKKTSIFVALAVAAFSFCGCAAHVSAPGKIVSHESVKATVKLEPARYKPILRVSPRKISGKGEAIALAAKSGDGVKDNYDSMTDPSIFDGLGALEASALRNAIRNTCIANNAEFLLAPTYVIQLQGKTATCTVSGFPATIVAVVPVDSNDDPDSDSKSEPRVSETPSPVKIRR